MTDFIRNTWRALSDERTQRWILPPYAAVCFLAMFLNTAPGWKAFSLALGVIYTFAAGWLWREWAHQQRVRRWLHEAASTLAGESGGFRKGEWR